MATYTNPNPTAAPQTPQFFNFEGSQGFGLPAQQFGLQDLFRLLSQKGQTDPTAMNQMLSGIDRGTQGAQDMVQSQAASSGLQNSGLAKANQAAVGQGGRALKAKTIAADKAAADERQRQNLALLYQLVIGPGTEMFGINKNFQAQMDAAKRQQKAGYANATANLIGGIVPG